jgi:hypothetical protein
VPRLVARTGVATAEQRRLQAEADELARTALARTRAAADGWFKALGSVTALFGLATLFKGPETVNGFAPEIKLAVGVLFMLALVAALAAIVLAALASHGTIGQGARGYEEQAEISKQELGTAVSRLGASRGVALIAVVPLLVALGVAWFAPRTAEKRVLLTRADGTTLCLPSGTPLPLSVSLEGITAVELVRACPKHK